MAKANLMARGCLLIACVATVLAPTTGALAEVVDPIVDAVWKPQRVNFEYRGYGTLYTCGSLEDKLEAILERIGAREDLRVGGYACDDQIGIARFHIDFNSPVEATPDNIRALTAYDARDVLIARARAETLASPEDLAHFPAIWKTVSFARDRKLKLQAGDCELVRQLRRQVLSRMSVRIVTDRVHCSSAFGNIGPPRLTVSALVPAPASIAVGD
ncbi:MAG: hypothetical protein ACREV5_01285 [Steroidobacter sp.]